MKNKTAHRKGTPLKLKRWPEVKGLIISKTRSGTVDEFARALGVSTRSLPLALQGKCPKVLASMTARLGSLAA